MQSYDGGNANGGETCWRSLFPGLTCPIALLVIFVVVYKWKGLKNAIIATGSAFLVFAGMIALAIAVIVKSMGN